MTSGEQLSSLSSTSRASIAHDCLHEVWRAVCFVHCACSGCYRLQIYVVHEREGDRL